MIGGSWFTEAVGHTFYQSGVIIALQKKTQEGMELLIHCDVCRCCRFLFNMVFIFVFCANSRNVAVPTSIKTYLALFASAAATILFDSPVRWRAEVVVIFESRGI